MAGEKIWSTDNLDLDAQAANDPIHGSLDEQEDDLNSVADNDEESSPQEDGCSPSASSSRKGPRYKYPRTSCQLCKARKVKCDRALPACARCAANDRDCIYLERQKPLNVHGSHLELDAKLNRVEELVSSLGRRIEDYLLQYRPATPHSVATVLDNPDSFRSNSFSTSEDENAITRPWLLGPDARPSQLQSPSWQDEGGGGEQLLQYQAAASAHTLSKLDGTFGDSTMASVSLDLGVSSQEHSLGSDLPPHDVLFTLVDLYFKHCNTWCSILDRKTTFACFFGLKRVEEPDLMLLRAIVVCALRFWDGPQLTPEMRAYYYTTSKQAVQVYTMQEISIPALRALVIITLDEIGSSNGPHAWNLLALLAQNVRQLDLWDELSVFLSADSNNLPSTGSIRMVTAGRPPSWVEDEGRRRLCWAVYLLDRYAAMATTTFDFMLREDKMNRSLPCSYDLFTGNIPVATSDRQALADATIRRPENLGSFSYHCGILRLLSKIHEFLKKPINLASSTDVATWRSSYHSHDRALNRWLQSIPAEYGRMSKCHWDPGSCVANWLILQSAYVLAVVRLHSPAAYPTAQSNFFRPSHYAMQRCLSAVESLSELVQDVTEADSLHLLGLPFIFSLWVAARLLLVHAATLGCRHDSKVEGFIETLRKAGKHWKIASTYADVLTRVVAKSGQGAVDFSIMRRNAYDLVSLASTTRRFGSEQTSTQVVSLGELDNIDVFDFFNYPKVFSSEPSQLLAPVLR